MSERGTQNPVTRSQLGANSSPEEAAEHVPVLDAIERVSEVVFGVLMATTMTGSLSVATKGAKAGTTMLFAAIGCNLAWGITDAMMYLIGIQVERHRRVAWLSKLQTTQDDEVARRLIAGMLPRRLAAGATTSALESMRKALQSVTPPLPYLRARDYAGAVGVLVLMVSATFPVVFPYILISRVALAQRISNLLAIITLFTAGGILGRYSDGSPWRSGLSLAAIGVVLVGVIVVLGG